METRINMCCGRSTTLPLIFNKYDLSNVYKITCNSIWKFCLNLFSFAISAVYISLSFCYFHLSAVFDTVDNCILQRRLCVSYGIRGVAWRSAGSALT